MTAIAVKPLAREPMSTGSPRSAPALTPGAAMASRYAVAGDEDYAGELTALVQPDEHPPYRLRLAALKCRSVDRLCQAEAAGSTEREEQRLCRELHHSLTKPW